MNANIDGLHVLPDEHRIEFEIEADIKVAQEQGAQIIVFRLGLFEANITFVIT